MPTMDVFSDDAFGTVSLSGMVQTMDYIPSFLGGLNIFEPVSLRTRNFFVDRRDGRQVLIPTSADGAPPENLDTDNRSVVAMRTHRLTKSFTLYATEVEGIRATGSESELEAVQAEYRMRSGRLMGDLDLTREYHRLNALMGITLDADGVTVLYDYFAEFGETQEAVQTFTFSDANFDVRQKSHDIRRSMARSARGAFTTGTSVHALCGDTFYDELISHPTVEKFYLQWQAAEALRETDMWSAFRHGGITYHNYRGTDDNATVAVPDGEAKFFPIGARDMFKVAHSPLESMEYVNTLGQPQYMMNIRDRDRDFWVKGEVYAYPIYMCEQPRVLRRGNIA